ncbi:MAG TPA: sensor histidine kinase [Jatrophihabitantaceae bacterium]|nr:sensor histidine kinase [Jatrophihabitantaceae bacterium]
MTDRCASDSSGSFRPWSLDRRDGAARWRRIIFPAIWLIYLGQTANGVSKHSSGWAESVGYAVLVAFCVCYLLALPFAWAGQRKRFWALYAATVALVAIETVFAHEDAFAMLTFVAVLTVGALGARSVGLLALYGLIAVVVPPAVSFWHAGLDFTPLITITLVGLAMYGFFGLIRSNQQLADARAEVARLAAENERTRIARDLHDLLGHSLTTITVKAGLARRLAERHDERAITEIAEVEELSRRSLGDVRAAVAGHREVTLAGELATAREVLRAAGIVAELPGSVDVVDPSRSELFGWVVREGVTNVVRHARASHCTVRVDRDWIEITDDGRGGIAGAGNGLTGLRERVEAAGGTVHVGAAPHRGWRLRVDAPLEPAAASDPAPRPARETPTMTA